MGPWNDLHTCRSLGFYSFLLFYKDQVKIKRVWGLLWRPCTTPIPPIQEMCIRQQALRWKQGSQAPKSWEIDENADFWQLDWWGSSAVTYIEKPRMRAFERYQNHPYQPRTECWSGSLQSVCFLSKWVWHHSESENHYLTDRSYQHDITFIF